jgi:methylphosphotriester-DNA--protein-cysteine methyltransferase
VTRTWKLIGPDGKPYDSDRPGTLGGHRRGRIYGRLDCPAALRAIARGGYVMQRVFFLTEEHARSAGYRPCAVCLPTAYAAWKHANDVG